jgi:hypothetical protein
MADTLTPMTRGDMDRAAPAASNTAADTEMAKLVEEHHKSQQLERDEAALARMRSDPRHLNFALTSENARNQEALLEANIRDAKAGAEAAVTSRVLTDEQRAKLAIEGKVDFRGPSATVEGQIPLADFGAAVDHLRALGLTDAAVAAAVNGGRETRAAIADARWIFEELMGDEMWVAKLAAGNRWRPANSSRC